MYSTTYKEQNDPQARSGKKMWKSYDSTRTRGGNLACTNAIERGASTGDAG